MGEFRSSQVWLMHKLSTQANKTPRDLFLVYQLHINLPKTGLRPCKAEQGHVISIYFVHSLFSFMTIISLVLNSTEILPVTKTYGTKCLFTVIRFVSHLLSLLGLLRLGIAASGRYSWWSAIVSVSRVTVVWMMRMMRIKVTIFIILSNELHPALGLKKAISSILNL